MLPIGRAKFLLCDGLRARLGIIVSSLTAPLLRFADDLCHTGHAIIAAGRAQARPVVGGIATTSFSTQRGRRAIIIS